MIEGRIITGAAGDQDIPPVNNWQLPLGAANEAINEHQAKSLPGFTKDARSGVSWALLVLIVNMGWQNRGNVYITPEEGKGYALGIAGGAMILMLLMYRMRKHMRWTRSLGPVRHWFRAHMLLGVLGPVCILYHCNFQLGSTNGNIALFSMLLVAGSGLVGRYFYTRLHYGLYGKKADLARLGSDAATARKLMDKAFDASPRLQARLQKIETQAVTPDYGFLSSMIRLFTVIIKTHWYWISTAASLRRAIRNSAWSGKLSRDQRRFYYRYARHHLRIYLATIRKVAGLSFYERLFSLWHVLHLPLFIMLLISGIVHVFAVHMY